jgi:hypothetical protein
VKGVAEVEKSSSGPVPRDQLRAGNDDRERVVKRLNDAFSEGRLELSELEERVSAAYAAKTIGELAPLTADLPGGTPTSGTVPPPTWPPPAWPPPASPVPPGRPPTVQDLKQAAIQLAHSKINAKLERDRVRQQRNAAKRDRHQQREMARYQRHQVARNMYGQHSVAAWASVSAICFTIWLITVLTGGAAYPWFIWVAGPWGIMLLVHRLTNRRAS